jgi:hypothetical protein
MSGAGAVRKDQRDVDREGHGTEISRWGVDVLAELSGWQSERDIEDLLAERGLDISYETVRSWAEFGDPAGTAVWTINGLNRSST